MNLVCISDTHGLHDHVRVPPCDVLIHAGDCTNDAGRKSLRDFLTWLERQPALRKVLIAGNHDWAFEKWPDLARAMIAEVAPSVTYLQDSGVEIDGIRFWGSPYQPAFCDWAFNLPRGEALKRHWDLIPEGTDVLITHGPARGILDISGFDNERCGCDDLLATIQRVKPRLHVFGHIHHSYGTRKVDDTTHLNASICDEGYRPSRAPWQFALDKLS